MRRLAVTLLVLAVPTCGCLLASQAALQMRDVGGSGGGRALVAEVEAEGAQLREITAAESADLAEFTVAYQVGDHTVQARDHALLKHGAAVLTARAAMQPGPQRRRECPQSDRVINMTPLDNGQWAVMIEGLASHVELTCWIVSAEDVERTWIRLLEMHKCPADPAQKAWGHDDWNMEVR